MPVSDVYTRDEWHRAIGERMRQAGINLVPVVVLNGGLYDGLHRTLLTQELGLPSLRVTDDAWFSRKVYGEVLLRRVRPRLRQAVRY